MTTNEVQWPLDNRNVALFIPILIAVIRLNRSLSWVITAQRHKPSEQFLATFDEVHRQPRPGRMYWVCIRGGTLSKDAVRGLVDSHQNMTEGWEKVDLSKFD